MAVSIYETVKAVYTALSGDGTLTAMLGTYASATAIFSGPEVPADVRPGSAGLPYVHIMHDVGLADFSSKDFVGLTLRLNVAVIVDRTTSSKEVWDILSRIDELLHNTSLSISGATHVMTRLAGSATVPATGDLTGQVALYEITIQPS